MPEAVLYLLSESPFDDEFFRVIFQRITGWEVPNGPDRDTCNAIHFIGVNDDDQNEIEGYFTNLRAKARGMAARSGNPDNVFLVVVRDNDRGPFSPQAGQPDSLWAYPLGKTHRLRQLEQCRSLIHTPDGRGAVFPCAVGVSVQMIESWLLLAGDPSLTDSSLPIFAEKTQATPKTYYQSLTPPIAVPPQLKDLYDNASGKARRQKRRNYNRQLAENVDIPSLALRSPSFAAFHTELEALPKPVSAGSAARPGGSDASA